MHYNIINTYLKIIDPNIEFDMVGSFRRKKEEMGDIDILIKNNNKFILENLVKLLCDKKYIIEKHNWLSTINSKNHEIHIPKKLVFPLKKIKGFQDIFFPNQGQKLCSFLYGDSWRSPLKKNTGYRMEIVNNRPKLIKRSFLGSITRSIKKSF